VLTVRKGDTSLEDTVKRETYEEIGLHPSHVQLIGSFGPIERSLSGNLVHPFAVCA
jgi:ADP-ribose pyrophosphatase YjhB (NUDIX family)